MPPSTRSRLVSAICEAVSILADILDTQASSLTSNNSKNTSNNNNDDDTNNGKDKGSSPAPLVPVTQIFRDAFACHLYMLYNVMFTFESEDKLVKLSSTVNLSSSLGATNNNNKGGNKRRKGGKKNKNGGSSSNNNNNNNQDFLQDQREMCANVMLKASQIIHLPRVKAKMWKCGVPDENLISLPCRISYVMLENNSFSKHACAIISSTCISHLSNNKNNNKSVEDGSNSSNGEEQQKQTTNWNQSTTSSFMNTVSAAVLDLLHSYEHIAPLVARQLLSNHLAVDLLQEISRTDYSPSSQNNSSTQDHHHHKATGVKNVAPFISELASVKPSLVLDHIYLILPLLNSDPYMMRNSIVEAIGSILIHCCSDNNTNKNPINNSEENEDDEYNDPSEGETPEEAHQSRKKSSNSTSKNKTKTQNSLLDVLMERAYDKSSYTRNAVLKTWATLVKSNCIPLNRIHEVTKLAIDRLQDISVNVRKSSMQVSVLSSV